MKTTTYSSPSLGFCPFLRFFDLCYSKLKLIRFAGLAKLIDLSPFCPPMDVASPRGCSCITLHPPSAESVSVSVKAHTQRNSIRFFIINLLLFSVHSAMLLLLLQLPLISAAGIYTVAIIVVFHIVGYGPPTNVSIFLTF